MARRLDGKGPVFEVSCISSTKSSTLTRDGFFLQILSQYTQEILPRCFQDGAWSNRIDVRLIIFSFRQIKQTAAVDNNLNALRSLKTYSKISKHWKMAQGTSIDQMQLKVKQQNRIHPDGRHPTIFCIIPTLPLITPNPTPSSNPYAGWPFPPEPLSPGSTDTSLK